MARKRGSEESVGGYFRRILGERPELLKAKTNAEILARYRADHGLKEDEAVPKNIVSNLGNVKSQMRKKARKRGRPAGKAAVAAPKPPRNLETLEVMIDDCMMFARSLDRDGLDNVWRHLRSARNQVVLKMG